MKQAEARQYVADAVEKALGDGKVICSRCNATLETYGDDCTAALDDPCPGFAAIEAVRAPAARYAYRLGSLKAPSSGDSNG